MVMEYRYGQMEPGMKENGKETKHMEGESFGM
jgi:translation initiation factor IF-1